MKLREFLDYQQVCPLCKNKLSIEILNSRKQQTRLVEDTIISSIVLHPINNKQKPMNIELSINIDNHSVQIDFIDDRGFKILNEIHLNQINRLKNFYENIGGCKINKICEKCEFYSYYSNIVDIFSDSIDFHITKEFYGAYIDENPKKSIINYRILNNHIDNYSEVVIYYSGSKMTSNFNFPYDTYKNFYKTIFLSNEMPILKFDSSEKIIEKLDKLIVFT